MKPASRQPCTGLICNEVVEVEHGEAARQKKTATSEEDAAAEAASAAAAAAAADKANNKGTIITKSTRGNIWCCMWMVS